MNGPIQQGATHWCFLLLGRIPLNSMYHRELQPTEKLGKLFNMTAITPHQSWSDFSDQIMDIPYDRVQICPIIWRTREEKINFSEKNLKIGLNFKLHGLLFTRRIFWCMTLNTLFVLKLFYKILFPKKWLNLAHFYVAKTSIFEFSSCFWP